MGFLEGMMHGGEAGIGGAAIRVAASFEGMREEAHRAIEGLNHELKRAGQTGATGVTTMNRELDETTRKTKGLAPHVAGMNRELDVATQKAHGFGMVMKAAIAGVVLSAAGLGVMAVKTAIEWESAFAGIRKTVDFGNVSIEESEERFAELDKQIREMSATLPIAATELAKLGETAGALGVPTENITEFIRVTAQIGSTTNVAADQAATALGQLSNVLNLGVDDYGRFAAALVDLGNKGASTESEILEITRRAGAMGESFGLSTQETLGLSAAIADLGMESEAGGSSAQRLLTRLTQLIAGRDELMRVAKSGGLTVDELVGLSKDSTKTGKANFEALAAGVGKTTAELKKVITTQSGYKMLMQLTGLDAAGIQRAQRENPAEILTRMVTGLGKMEKLAQTGAIKTLLGGVAGGDVNMLRMLLGLTKDSEDLARALDRSEEAWSANTAAEEEFGKKAATTANQIKLLGNIFEDLLGESARALLPVIVEVAQWIAERLPKAAEELAHIWGVTLGPALDKLAGAFGALVTAVGDLFFNWSGDAAHDATTGLERFASVLADAATFMADLLNATTALLSNPIINGIAKLGAGMLIVGTAWRMIAGAAATIKGIGMAGLGVGRGIGGATLATLTGGRIGAGRGGAAAVAEAASDPTTKMQLSAAETQAKAGLEQNRAAEMQLRAAMAAGASAEDLAAMQAQMMGAGAGAAAGGAAASDLADDALAARTAALEKDVGQAKAGGGVWSRTRERVGAGTAKIAGKVSAAGMGVKALAAGALGLASEAIIPLLVGAIVADIAKDPIGDAFKGRFDRVAGAWHKSFVDGYIATIQAALQGTDEWVDRAKNIVYNHFNLSSDTARKFGLSADRTFDLSEQGGNAALVGNVNAAEGIAGNTGRKDGETEAAYRDRLIQYLRDNGVDIPGLNTTRTVGRGKGARRITEKEVDTAVLAALARDHAKIAVRTSTAEIVDAIVEGFRASGKEISRYSVVGMDASEREWIVRMLEDLPADLQFLAEFQAEEFGAGKLKRQKTDPNAVNWNDPANQELAKKYGEDLAAAAIDLKAAAAEQGKAAEDLSLWQAQQKLDPKSHVGAGLNWLSKFGADIEAGLGGEMKPEEIVKKFFPDTLPEEIEAKWEELQEHYAAVIKMTGADQSKLLAENAQGMLEDALKRGMTLEQAKAFMGESWDTLWDSIGTKDSDIADRLALSVRNTLTEALQKADTDAGKAEVLRIWNAIMPEAGETKSFDELWGAILDSFTEEINAADTAAQKNAVIDKINEMLPEKMHFQSWPDLIKAMFGQYADEIDAVNALSGSDKRKAQRALIRQINATLPKKEQLKGTLSEKWQQVLDLAAKDPNLASFFETVVTDSAKAGIEDATSNAQPQSVIDFWANQFGLPMPSELVNKIGDWYQQGVASIKIPNLPWPTINGTPSGAPPPVTGARAGGGSLEPGRTYRVGEANEEELIIDAQGRGRIWPVAGAIRSPRPVVAPPQPAMPALAQASASGPTAPPAPSLTQQSRTQNLYIDRVNLQGQGDEVSLLRQFQFMAPA